MKRLLQIVAIALVMSPCRVQAQATEPYLGQILMVGFNFAPVGWAMCNGEILPISEYPALFQLIGTTFGGDGINTFALPDLRGRVPIHMGQGLGLSNYVIGQQGGEEEVTLTISQMPAHTHALAAQSALGSSANPTGGIWASQSRLDIYSSASPDTPMGLSTTSAAGGSQPHDNRSPYLVVNYIIALEGVFPTQN